MDLNVTCVDQNAGNLWSQVTSTGRSWKNLLPPESSDRNKSQKISRSFIALELGKPNSKSKKQLDSLDSIIRKTDFFLNTGWSPIKTFSCWNGVKIHPLNRFPKAISTESFVFLSPSPSGIKKDNCTLRKDEYPEYQETAPPFSSRVFSCEPFPHLHWPQKTTYLGGEIDACQSLLHISCSRGINCYYSLVQTDTAMEINHRQ